MSRAWWIRMSIIIGAILWSFYVLTPTFMAQSSRDKLAAQANAAQDAAYKKKKEKDDNQTGKEPSGKKKTTKKVAPKGKGKKKATDSEDGIHFC